MSTTLRSKGEIVLIVTSSGISALLVPGGRTAHSRFKIPLNIDDYLTCEITPKDPLANLICHAKLIIWDKAPMIHKHCFEVVDHTLNDILREKKYSIWWKDSCVGWIFWSYDDSPSLHEFSRRIRSK